MAAHWSFVALGFKIVNSRTWISLEAAFDWFRIDAGFYFGSICDLELMLVEEQAADIPALWGARPRTESRGTPSSKIAPAS